MLALILDGDFAGLELELAVSGPILLLKKSEKIAGVEGAIAGFTEYRVLPGEHTYRLSFLSRCGNVAIYSLSGDAAADRHYISNLLNERRK